MDVFLQSCGTVLFGVSAKRHNFKQYADNRSRADFAQYLVYNHSKTMGTRDRYSRQQNNNANSQRHIVRSFVSVDIYRELYNSRSIYFNNRAYAGTFVFGF